MRAHSQMNNHPIQKPWSKQRIRSIQSLSYVFSVMKFRVSQCEFKEYILHDIRAQIKSSLNHAIKAPWVNMLEAVLYKKKHVTAIQVAKHTV